MDSNIFLQEKYTEREAWEWIISGAAWQPEGLVIPVNHNPVRIMRGQLSHSLRFLGTAWGWDKAKVSRFLNKLKKWDMVETATETGQILITICNYSQYQDLETTTETGGVQKPIRRRDRGETNIKNLNNSKKEELNIYTPNGVENSVWEDFTKLRKSKRSPLTETALNGIRREAEKAGISLNAALKECCERGWQGFKADWYKPNNTKGMTKHERINKALDDAERSINATRENQTFALPNPAEY
jgi:hypothetical protein